MKKLFGLILMGGMALFATSCGGGTQMAKSNESKTLVLYYSQTGVTKTVAEELKGRLGADIETIEIENAYDGDFEATVARVKQEMADSVLPKVKPLEKAVADYDTIFLGYPIWCGTYAPPVISLLEETDFSGKVIVPFCTFGSGGLEVSVRDLKAAQPNANVREGYGVRTARIGAMPNEVERFLIEGGYISGEVEALPEYSTQEGVNDEEMALFDAACGNYQFPLGRPISCGKRVVGERTDYEFTVKANDPQGCEVMNTIYVSVEGGKAEFTKVVR